MLTRNDFIERFVEMVRDVADIDIDANSLITDAPHVKLYHIGIDSLTVVSILNEFEQRFDTTVLFEDIDENTFDSAHNLIEFLFVRLKEPSA